MRTLRLMITVTVLIAVGAPSHVEAGNGKSAPQVGMRTAQQSVVREATETPAAVEGQASPDRPPKRTLTTIRPVTVQQIEIKSDANNESEIDAPQSKDQTPAEVTIPMVYEIQWYSVNSGGRPASSTTYELDATAGQPAQGESNSPSYASSAGYLATTPTCTCSCHGDPQCDGVTNVLDVVQAVNVAFKGWSPVLDSDCTRERTDVTCDGFTNVIDVVRFVNVAFKGESAQTQFCNGCL